MKKTLLKKTPIGESLSMQVEMENHVIRLDIVSKEGSARHSFSFAEWEDFVDGVKQANASMAGEED